MKNKKWLTYTLGILFTLIALAAVGVAGFRIGMTQNTAFGRMSNGGPAFGHNFANNSQMMQGNNPGTANGNFGGNQHSMQGNPRGNDFGGRQHNDRRGGFSIFGLVQLAVAGLLIWFGYKLVKNSGWKLVRVETTAPAAPVVNEPVDSEAEEKKE